MAPEADVSAAKAEEIVRFLLKAGGKIRFGDTFGNRVYNLGGEPVFVLNRLGNGVTIGCSEGQAEDFRTRGLLEESQFVQEVVPIERV